jgi:hypothetical protein
MDATAVRWRCRPVTKQEALQLIQELPDDATLDDIIYELDVVRRIERGLEDVAAGRAVSHEEAMREVAEWIQRSLP